MPSFTLRTALSAIPLVSDLCGVGRAMIPGEIFTRERERFVGCIRTRKHPCAFRAEPTHANPAQREHEKNLKTHAQKLQIL